MIVALYIGLALCILFLFIVVIILLSKSKKTTIGEESTEDVEIRNEGEDNLQVERIIDNNQISRPANSPLVTLNFIAAFIILVLGIYIGISFIIEANKILSLFRVEGIYKPNGVIYVAGFAIIGIVALIALLFYNQASSLSGYFI